MTLLQGLFAPPGLFGLLIGIVLALAVGAGSFWYVREQRAALLRRQRELAATARRNQLLVEASGEGVLELDATGAVRYANPAAARALGYEVNELIGIDYRVLINARETTDSTGRPQKVRYVTDIAREVGAILKRKDGQRRPIEYRVVPMSAQGGGVGAGAVLTFSDVTDRVRLDTLVRDMQRTARVGGWEYDLATKRLTWTDMGFAAQELPLRPGMSVDDVLKNFHADDRERLLKAAHTVKETGQLAQLEVRTSLATGREMWIRIIIKGERRDNVAVRLRGTFQDVTDRIQAERQVRETRDFYELTLDAMPVLVAYINSNLVLTYANAALLQAMRKPRERVIGKHLKEVISSDRFVEFMDDVDAVLRGESRVRTGVNFFEGRMRDAQVNLVPQLDASGRALGFFTILFDISELKRLEQRLVQAQKMEAIGQLTGGIAHDFNNMLMVVSGHAQSLKTRIKTPRDVRAIDAIELAARRGERLTRQLLAFSRRQALNPSVVRLDERLDAFRDVLESSARGNIELVIDVASNIWPVSIDVPELELAMVNIVVNARDAMPDGGRIEIKAENVRLLGGETAEELKGDFVALSVNDSGGGIPAEILSRVFEPFFTTKQVDKGTGLGLSQVYGFTRQSGGTTAIISRPGSGTTVTIYLPRSLVDRDASRGDA
ncbi:MAG TPA: PAS domain S-box protein, partial [Steroidobacteraceae bacterium]|nr:PAS domain S-box protein [Steroidobacteraceae bacterium]